MVFMGKVFRWGSLGEHFIVSGLSSHNLVKAKVKVEVKANVDYL